MTQNDFVVLSHFFILFIPKNTFLHAPNQTVKSVDIFFTLITGGSQGIGKALARECAKRKMNLLIIALPDEHLETTAQQIRDEFKVEVATLGMDLSQQGAAKKTLEWCQENNYQVNMLINNAGFGRSGWLEKLPLNTYRRMIGVNNQALFEFCYEFLPMLKANKTAYILNMSSLEAYLPTPYKAVYTATKHFVFAFSLALKEELKSFDVHVSVLCPGSTLTNEDGLKRIQAMGRTARIAVMMPEPVAEIAINKLLKKKQIIIPGNVNKFIVFLSKIIPVTRKMRLLEKIFRSYVNEDS